MFPTFPTSKLVTRTISRIFDLPASARAFTVSSVLTAEGNSQEEGRSQPDFRDRAMSSNEKPPKVLPRPSSSVLLISPTNQVLLLQRVKQSSSFPSAHVFPGGNVSPDQDGELPAADSTDVHFDSDPYRMAAIRECFEESGILLAKNNGFGRHIEVEEAERESGRKAIHANEISFTKWLAQKGGRADTDGLIPFTRWVTPTNLPRRFTTQMYLYFLPTFVLTPMSNSSTESDDEAEVRIPVPTTDGGLEHTNIRWLPASVWCRLAQEGRIILFPPQFFLLHQLAQHFDNLPSPAAYGSISRESLPREELEARRKSLLKFVKSAEPPWSDKVISPTVLPARDGGKRDDNRSVLSLDKPGPELVGSGRMGLRDQCILVNFRKEGPRHLAVISREEALDGAKL